MESRTKPPVDHSKPVIFIVDDDRELRETLVMLVQSVNLDARAYGSGLEFLSAFDPQQRGCLVVDLRMPGMSGLELQQELGRRGISIPIIFMSGYADVPSAIQAVKAGAFDFIEKPLRQQELLDRVNSALEVDRKERYSEERRAEAAALLSSLTPREREVMEKLVSGMRNKEMAKDLGISKKTVEVHRSRIMAKTQVSSLAELVRLVLTQQRDGS